jgi:hypothetical protein
MSSAAGGLFDWMGDGIVEVIPDIHAPAPDDRLRRLVRKLMVIQAEFEDEARQIQMILPTPYGRGS